MTLEEAIKRAKHAVKFHNESVARVRKIIAEEQLAGRDPFSRPQQQKH